MKAVAAVPSTVRLVAALVTGLAAFRYGHDVVKLIIAAPTIDFTMIYGFARAFLAGVDPFTADGLRWVDGLLGVQRAGTPATFPPAGYLIFLPIVWLPLWLARLAWLLSGQACLVLALTLLHRRLAPDVVLAMAGLFVVLTYQPIFEDTALGTVNLLLLALITLALLGHARGSVIGTALPLSLAAVLKLPYIGLIPLVWWLGSPSTAALAVGLALTWSVFAALVFGTGWFGAYWAFLSVGSAPLHAWPRNLSPHAVLHRLVGVEQPDFRIEAMAIVVAFIVVAVVAVVTRDAGRDREARIAAWALALAALPLATPLAEENQLVVQLIPLLYALAQAPRLRTTGERLALLAAILLLASRYSLEDFAMFSHGILSLAQTGKIVGLALLAALIARLIGRRPLAE